MSTQLAPRLRLSNARQFEYASREFSTPHQRPQPLSDAHSKREVTQEKFAKFLAWLDPDLERAGEEYVQLRYRLCTFFSQRHCTSGDELADETINRVIDKVWTETIEHKTAFCLGVARNVYREWLRQQRVQLDINDVTLAAAEPEEPSVSSECLDKCLAELPPEVRNLLLEYFSDAKLAKIKLHKGIAERLETSQTAVRMRVMRAKQKLKLCVEHCMA